RREAPRCAEGGRRAAQREEVSLRGARFQTCPTRPGTFGNVPHERRRSRARGGRNPVSRATDWRGLGGRSGRSAGAASRPSPARLRRINISRQQTVTGNCAGGGETVAMLGFGWLALRQAQEALTTGRLEEA